jgi:hypothetical protein
MQTLEMVLILSLSKDEDQAQRLKVEAVRTAKDKPARSCSRYRPRRDS